MGHKDEELENIFQETKQFKKEAVEKETNLKKQMMETKEALQQGNAQALSNVEELKKLKEELEPKENQLKI